MWYLTSRVSARPKTDFCVPTRPEIKTVHENHRFFLARPNLDLARYVLINFVKALAVHGANYL